ncbi:unnamed protein product, partial [Rotaria sp. Silwood1]
LKPLIIEQCAKVTKTTVVYPSERYGTIRRIADQRRFNNDSYLEKFDLTVNINKMLMSPAKILQTPEIRYKSSRSDQNYVFLKNQHELDNQSVRLARDSLNRIPQVMRKYGIRFNSSPIE